MSGATKKLEAKQIGHQDLKPAIVTKNRRYTSQQYLDLHAFSSGLVVNVTRPYIQLELTMREYIQDKYGKARRVMKGECKTERYKGYTTATTVQVKENCFCWP